LNKADRKKKNQEMAARMKRDGIERTTGRCPICNAVVHADFLGRGMNAHRCERLQTQ
jgi:hypothetical protein